MAPRRCRLTPSAEVRHASHHVASQTHCDAATMGFQDGTHRKNRAERRRDAQQIQQSKRMCTTSPSL
jgi:hypothetical protein